MHSALPPSADRKKPIARRVLASIAALCAFGAFGLAGTWSAFTDTTQADGSHFVAGTVDITNDSAGTALFDLTGLVPGMATTRCINVTNDGDVPFANVQLTGTASGALAPALRLTVDRGSGATGGASASCTSFTASTAGLIDTTLSALGGLTPGDDTSGWAAGASKSYRVTVTLDANAAGTYQGESADLTLTWTASA